MATAARLPLAAWRNELCVRTIRFVGIDLTGVDMRGQIRLRPDAPGAPLIDLETVSTLSAQGLKLDSVATEGGVPVSTVNLRINEATMTDPAKVPYGGEPGTDTALAYAIQFGGVTRLVGQFIALATVMDSEGSPVGSVSGYGSATSGMLPWSAAQLTFSDDAIEIKLDGVDYLAQLLAAGAAFASDAEDAATLARLYAVSDTDAPIAGADSTADRGARYESNRARAWAESTIPPITGSKSAKSWAGESAASAALSDTRANAAAGSAATAALAAIDAGAYLSGVQTAVTGIPTGSQLSLQATSRAVMAAFTGQTAGRQVILSESGRAGLFEWLTGNQSAKVTADPDQALYVPPAAATNGSAGVWSRVITIGFAVASWAGVVAGGTADAAAPINRLLAHPAIRSVMLPAGNISTDSALVVQTGKHLLGAGRGGVTRVVRFNNISSSAYLDKVVIRSAEGAIGVRVSDLDVVSPKVADKVNGVWMLGAKYFVVERVNAYNCGYAFWAQSQAQYGVFRDCGSWNANVHFETTRGYDILFENGVSGDGDGDNPLGCEAVWHNLYESKRVTFRNMTHSGKGMPFMVIADASAGTTDNGLIDDILFDRCRAVMTQEQFAFLMSQYSGTVGRIKFKDCEVTVPFITGLIAVGDVTMENCTWRTNRAEGINVQTGAKLRAVDCDYTITDSSNAFGAAYNSGSGDASVIGGSINLIGTAPMQAVGAGVYLSPSTRVTGMTGMQLLALGHPGRVILAADSVWQEYIGQNTATPMETKGGPVGAVYRVRARGLVRHDAGGFDNLNVFISSTGNAHSNVSGFMRLDTSDDGSTPPKSVVITVNGELGAPGSFLTIPIANDQVASGWRYLEIDVTYTSSDAGSRLRVGPNATTKAGFEMTVEQIA